MRTSGSADGLVRCLYRRRRGADGRTELALAEALGQTAVVALLDQTAVVVVLLREAAAGRPVAVLVQATATDLADGVLRRVAEAPVLVEEGAHDREEDGASPLEKGTGEGYKGCH